MPLNIAVVGGGLGGLSAAIQLATRGHAVTLLERNAELGGKAARYEERGYSFDTGPSLVTMPETLDELFAAAGEKREDHLPLARLPLQCRYLFADGRALDIADDPSETLRNIEAAFPGHGREFDRLVETSRAIREAAGQPFLDRPYEGFVEFGRTMKNPLAALRWGVLQGSLGDVARARLTSEHLRWIVQRYATYAGGGPDQSPAAYAMIVDLELRGGAHYPPGGIVSIPRALHALATRVGVKVVTGADVTRIEVREGRVAGVVVNGASTPFDAVVSNADPVFVAERLLDPAAAARSGLDRHVRQELGTSGFVLLLGVRGRLDHLAHHTVLFPRHYPDEFRDLFTREIAPDDPTVYLCIPSRTDPTRAPDGSESVFAMINAPATSGRVDWKAQAPELAARVKRIVAARAIPGLEGRIEVEHVVGPDELRARFNAPGGSIYGVSPHGRMSPLHRPMPRAEGLSGLYFAGGGTHPGGGIPLVLRSGAFAARLIDKDLAKGRLRAATSNREVA